MLLVSILMLAKRHDSRVHKVLEDFLAILVPPGTREVLAGLELGGLRVPREREAELEWLESRDRMDQE